MWTNCRSLFITILLSAFFSTADAQTQSKINSADSHKESFRQNLESEIIKDEEENQPFEIDYFTKYLPSRKVNAMPGEIGVTESACELSYEWNVLNTLPVELSLEAQYFSINNTTRVTLPSHLNGLTAGIETTLPFFNFDKTYVRVGVSPAFYADTWDFDSSSFRIPFHSFLIYQFNNRWTFIAGVGVFPDFENKILPIAGFIYKPNTRLTFSIVPKNPNVSYVLNPRVTLFVEDGSLLNTEFEVKKDNLENVVLKYNETRLGTGIKYKFNKFIQSAVSVGAIFNRSLEYRDSLGKVDIKNGMYTEFKIEMHI